MHLFAINATDSIMLENAFGLERMIQCAFRADAPESPIGLVRTKRQPETIQCVRALAVRDALALQDQSSCHWRWCSVRRTRCSMLAVVWPIYSMFYERRCRGTVSTVVLDPLWTEKRNCNCLSPRRSHQETRNRVRP